MTKMSSILGVIHSVPTHKNSDIILLIPPLSTALEIILVLLETLRKFFHN